MHSAAHFFRRAGMFSAILVALGLAAGENPASELKKAKIDFETGRWSDAEARLSRIWNETPSSAFAEEAGALLIDVYLREEKPDLADGVIQRFKRQFESSPQLSRVLYDQGILALKKGLNGEAAQDFAAAAMRARTAGLHDAASLALHRLVEGHGLQPDEMETVWQSLAKDPDLGPWLLEQMKAEQERLEKLIPRDGRTVLLMAPFSGEFSEVGRSLREGVALAFEEAKARGAILPKVKVLDDQGNLVQGVRQLRKLLHEERVDAIVGPAMSDVAAGVAIELSASKSAIPLITPTATTYGIASLGDGVFQLNVTTHVLGQRIAGYASDCLGLRNFIIVAPHSEYGFQLAEAFAETVRKKGGAIVAAIYVDPDAADLSEPLQELRQKVANFYFSKSRSEGRSSPEGHQMRSYMSDSTFSVDGIFIPAASGDEVDRLASQIVFNKIRGQLLGSSGWYDKALLLKSSEASQGAYFSVDFQDQPKTEVYAAFSRAYKSRWKRAPDRAAALSYDAARFLLQGMQSSSKPETLIPALRAIPTFSGVLGNIVFGGEGVNQNTALFQLQSRSFHEVPDCVAK